ncbi:MAG: helix-turn-helix domain-containing protein [Actinomycetota bacterium]|nr:helix-turn-helix domain-containing protein [Actinomycetota bacterium]
MPSTRDYIGSAEACTILGVHGSTLGRWVKAGRITPVTQLPGANGAMLFARADVLRLAAEYSEASA